MDRTACIWIPRFELECRLRDEPELATQPVLLVDVSNPGARVLEASLVAQRFGVRSQMLITRARALCPDALLIPPDGRYLRTQRDKMLALLYELAPTTGRDDKESFFISLEGLHKLYPDEKALAVRILTEITARGLQASVAIADDPVSAWVVARATQQERLEAGQAYEVVPSGQEHSFLAELPLEALPMPEQVTRLCHLLGIDRIGALQKLPPGSLTRRFGRAGEQIGLRARGKSREGDLFVVEIPQQIEQSELHLDQPTDALDVLTFLHKTALDRLIKQVRGTGRVIAALSLQLQLADSARTRITHLFRPARPTLDGQLLLDLMLLWLNSTPASDLVDVIVMRAVEVGVPPWRQLQLFAREREESMEALKLARSRLVAAMGAEAVVYPELADSHLPEARVCWRQVDTRTSAATSGRSTSGRGTTAWDPGQLPMEIATPAVLELFDPPVPISFSARRLRIAESKPQQILARSGPYTVEGEWWNEGFRREYWLLYTAEHQRLWVFREGSGSYLHAYFD